MKRTLLLLTVFAGCGTDLSLSASTIVSCEAGVCPDGLTCVVTRCVSPELIDTVGPALLSPDNGATLAQGTVELSWGTAPAASEYTLTVATDPEIKQLVGGTPRTVARNSESITLDPGTYYWRVRSDVTDPAAGTTRVFGVVSDAVYVACGAGDDCAVRDSIIELGTLELPYRAPSRAVAGAVRVGVREVRVASRPDDAAYDDAFAMADGVSVLGGYDASFTERSGRTVLTNVDTIVNAFAITAATRLDGFVLLAAPDIQSTVLRMLLVGAAFVVENVRFEAPLLRTSLLVVGTNADDIGPTVRNCELEGRIDDDTNLSPDPISPVVRILDGAFVTIEDTSIRASSALATPIPVGIAIDGASATVRNVTITLDARAAATGISVRGPGGYTYGKELRLENATISVQSRGLSIGVAANNDAVLHVTRSMIDVRGNTDLMDEAFGIEVDVAHVVHLSNNVIVASRSAVDCNACEGVFQNNTVASRGFGVKTLNFTGASYPRIVNNVLLGYPIFNHSIGFSSGAEPMGIVNNATVTLNCPDGCGLFAVTEYESQTFAPRVDGNLQFGSLGDAGLSNDFRPSQDSALIGRGADPVEDYCSVSVNSQPVGTVLAILNRVGSTSCGGVTIDRDNKQRPVAPTLGAYEP